MSSRSFDGDRGFVSAAQGVLEQNTNELTEAVTSVYGAKTGAAFRESWNAHIRSLVRYSDALAADDRAGQREARSELAAYASRYGQLMATATNGKLDAASVTTDVSAHIDHLLMQADAFAREDYPDAFRREREAYAAMFSTGKNLAGAIVANPAGELPAGFDSAPERLRSALGLLLGEHAELAFDASRAVVAGSPTAKDAAAALDANTRDIDAAMQAALGQDAANRFGDIWAEHIDALVGFSVAVAQNDDSGQTHARRRLEDFPSELGRLLSPLAAGRVAAQQVLEALQEHDQQLLQQVTAYAAKDYRRAHDIAYAGYEHMFGIAATLADVLEGRASATSPKGGAATGGGGLATRHRVP